MTFSKNQKFINTARSFAGIKFVCAGPSLPKENPGNLPNIAHKVKKTGRRANPPNPENKKSF